MTDSARQVWRMGFAPHLPVEGLRALARALAADDLRVICGHTVAPAWLPGTQDWPVEAADPVAFVLWQAHGLTTVGAVMAAWADACFACDVSLGVPSACRWFLNWIDDAPRCEWVPSLLAEVLLALREREAVAA
jgi:hypothetical protein